MTDCERKRCSCSDTARIQDSAPPLPVKFSLAEILVSGLRCTVHSSEPRPRFNGPTRRSSCLSISLLLLRTGAEWLFCRSSINVTNVEYGLFMKGSNSRVSVRDTNPEMDMYDNYNTDRARRNRSSVFSLYIYIYKSEFYISI